MELNYLETHLVDHCDLSCKGCGHFSPLSEKKFHDFNIFQKDLVRLRELFDNILIIRLMGGEPLLHPDVLNFLEFTRLTFPKAQISLVTNGILLLRQSETFWEKCSQNNILIQITRYPLKLDLEAIKRTGDKFNTKIEVSKMVTDFGKFINVAGDSNPMIAFCDAQCTFLKNGKVYPCAFPALIHIFNKYFEKNISVAKTDYLNIYETIHGSDILKFLSHPIPMCKWCLYNPTKFQWNISKKVISEWIGTNPSFFPRVFKKIVRQGMKKIDLTKEMLWLACVNAKRKALGKSRGTITINPNPIKALYVSGRAVADLSWNAEGTETIEVHVDAPDGPLFSRSGPSGKATTGKWVQDGMGFYLQDVSGGLPLTSTNTLDIVRASLIH
jgi:organic radical activating enzyme